MTNTPDTSPEAVERLALTYDSDDDMQHMETDFAGGWVRYENYAAISAALGTAIRNWANNELTHKLLESRDFEEARAEAAEAERDALKAENARLREALEYIRKPQYGLQGIIEDGDSDEERAAYFSGWCDRYQDRARAALRALEQG